MINTYRVDCWVGTRQLKKAPRIFAAASLKFYWNPNQITTSCPACSKKMFRNEKDCALLPLRWGRIEKVKKYMIFQNKAIYGISGKLQLSIIMEGKTGWLARVNIWF